MRKVFLVVVPFYPTTIPSASKVANSLPFFGKKKDKKAVDADDEKVFTENASQLQQRVDQVVDGIHQIGLEGTILDTQELVELYYNFYNPDSVEREEVPIPNSQS